MPYLHNINTMNAALQVREAQLSLTASNLINQDTPNFKAKGIDFREALSRQIEGSSTGLKMTDPRHIGGANSSNNMNIQYVQSDTAKGDGNTVNSHIEKAKFAELQIQYQAALTLSQNSASSLKKVLTESK